LIDEVRDEAQQRMKKYKGAMARYYDKKVKVRRFNPGDHILKKILQVRKGPSRGKLGPTWEGPCEVIQHSRQGSNYLKKMDGQELSCPWNIEHCT